MIHASLIKVLYSIKQTHFYAIHCLSHQEKKVAIKLRISIRKVLVFSSEPHQSREFSGGRFHLPQAESDFSEALRRFTGSRQNGWPVESPSNTASDVPPLEMLCSRLHIWLEVTIPKLIHAHRLERIRAAQGVGNELCPTHPATICAGGTSRVWWCPDLLSVFRSNFTLNSNRYKSIFIHINLFHNFKWQSLPLMVVTQGKWGCSDTN